MNLKPACALLVLLLPTMPVAAQNLMPLEFPGPLQSPGNSTPAKTAAEVYIVQLAESGAASYKGGVSGFAATKPAAGTRYDAQSPAVQSWVRRLETSHDELIASVGGAKIHSYRHAFNGFAGSFTADEITALAHRPEVIGIWRDSDHTLETNNSSLFLGLLDQTGGLRADLDLTGENVIVGIIDSGVDPDHPQLRDYTERVPRTCRSQWAEASWLGLMLCGSINRNPPTVSDYEPAADFFGLCQEGASFPASACNNKLLGARYYVDGFLLRHELDAGEYLSARDADGHGTHIATTIAGASEVASLFGARIGEISGIAPRARIAVYKACWLQPGDTRATCATSDLARAIDDAVADGVDIINYSVGSLETDLTAPEDLALLNAVDAGVLSVVAAGNDGPDNYTIGSPGSAPWVITVAASTQSGRRSEPAIEITEPDLLDSLLPMREASFTTQLSTLDVVEAPLVLADDGVSTLEGGGTGSIYDACEPLLNDGDLSGSVALIVRGGCTFEHKLDRVEAAGAVAAVVYTLTGDPIVMNSDGGTVAIPGVMIGPADGSFLVDSILAGDEPVARLAHGVLVEFSDSGDQVADFSSKGPSLSESDFLKPDITAPGVNILAGSTPFISNGTSGEYYQYLSGTSMATPMVAGIAALLAEAQPDWTPGTLKSALMTTAETDLVIEGGEFDANPFERGSGRVDGNLALDPGLVVDTSFEDYQAYLCGTDEPIIAASECSALATAGYPFEPEQLNLPSVGITEMIPGDVIYRRLTNVGDTAEYTATVEAPPGFAVTVEPDTIAIGSGETAEFRLVVDVTDAPYGFWQFGNLNWSDGTHSMNMPLAVQRVYLRSPRDLALPALSGSDSLPVDFGYSDAYLAEIHGLNAPGLDQEGIVADDPGNNFSFRFDNGVTGHYFNLAEDQLFLRVSLFDELTDGEDDLDLYLYHCPTLSTCTEVGQSGSFTSEEEIDLLQPAPGLYAALVHGFQTDQTSGGLGASYRILGWSFGNDEDRGNMSITAPDAVTSGERLDFSYDWGPLDPDTIYLGAVSHTTPFDVFFLTVVTANTP